LMKVFKNILTCITTVSCPNSSYFSGIQARIQINYTFSQRSLRGLLLGTLLGRQSAGIRDDISDEVPEGIFDDFFVMAYSICAEEPYSHEAEGKVQGRQAQIHA
jgi:hypothetical protein